MAAKIPVAALLADFQRMLREHWGYEWGKAETGCVDCSGAFAWAYAQHGQSIYQGSNRIARLYVAKLLPISAAKPGMAAFKARPPGSAGYALPSGYQPGGRHYNGDLQDYYHIGLVDDDPKYILNAQSTKTGFVRSPISQGWDAVGYLLAVDYGTEQSEGDETMQTMTVVADSGSTVNLRTRPDSGAKLLDRIPVGTQVQVLTISGGWATVQHDGLTGYMMDKYLASESDAKSLEERVAKLEERVAALEGGAG